MARQDIDPRVLEPVDEGKRKSMRKIIVGTAFAAPIVTSFPINGLGINQANAYVQN